MVLIALLLIIIAISGCTTQTDGGLTISQSVRDICQIKGNIDCIGDCVDGFGQDCYFDSKKFNKDDLDITGMSLTEETKEACIGIHSVAACGSCLNRFEIRTGEGFEGVSCEVFFQTLEDINGTCGGCIDTVNVGCC